MLAFVKSNRIKIAVVAAVVLLGGGAFMASSQAKAKKEAEAKAAAAAAPKSPFVAVANGKADVEGGMIQVAARRAGIVPTGFYRHFRDMDELGLALVDEVFPPRRLGDDEKDYFLGLPATGQPDTRTASTSGAAK